MSGLVTRLIHSAAYNVGPVRPGLRGATDAILFAYFNREFKMSDERTNKGGQRSGAGKRARRVLLCATGAYIVYSLPRIILHLLRHVADDVQVVLSREAAKL